MSYLITSEAVSKGHPDKVADQIADAILDQYLILNPNNRVAIEVTCCKSLILVTGEVSDLRTVNVRSIVKETLSRIGYNSKCGYDINNILIVDAINSQSPEIAAAVAKENGELGAGDQGIMFGYACNETPTFMPLDHHLAFQLIKRLEDFRETDAVGNICGTNLLYPDAKTQVTLSVSDDGVPEYVHTVVVSSQYNPDYDFDKFKSYVHFILKDVLEKYKEYNNEKCIWHINPAGPWHIGGPVADTGLSGRKLVVDNYGASSPIGGGSFSGKDPTKVDRSGAYAARQIAKHIVHSELSPKCQVQISYGIGLTQPLSVRVNTLGNFESDDFLSELASKVDLSPQGIIDRLQLRRPIYSQTAFGGHFGRNEFPWEQIDKTIDDIFKLG